MKLAAQQNHLGGQILYRSPCKKTKSKFEKSELYLPIMKGKWRVKVQKLPARLTRRFYLTPHTNTVLSRLKTSNFGETHFQHFAARIGLAAAITLLIEVRDFGGRAALRPVASSKAYKVIEIQEMRLFEGPPNLSFHAWRGVPQG